jgi:hypothetical protein
MLNKLIKNLISILVMIMAMPVGVAIAKPVDVEIENEVEVKFEEKQQSVVLNNVITEIKEVEAPKPIQKPGNSRDWSGYMYTPEDIKAKICAVFVNNCSEASIIAQKESGFRPWTISATNDYGVFQLNCKWQGRRVGGDCNKFLDIDTNISIAKQIYDEQGWNPWVTKKYLR